VSQPKYLEEALKKIKWERGNLLLAFDEAAQIVPNQIEFIKAQKNLLLELDSEFESNNPVTIAFLGQTGHGKSTLANAIIGYEVLPSSGSKVCTAGVTRVRHADIEGFKATITYLTEEAFRQELEFVKITLGMQNPHQVGDEPTQNADEFGDIKIPKTTEIRLRAIFGKEVFEKFVNL
jgi:ABC-type glutathione transport system ATPase component